MSDTTGDRSDADDRGFKPTPQQLAAQRRLRQMQTQVDEVVGIMRTNVEKVLERDQKLSELDDQANAVQKNASHFEHVTGGLTKDKWKNLKVMIIIGIIVFLILILVLADYYASKWLVLNKCLEGILGFRWCSNGTSTTSSPKVTTTSSTAPPLIIVHHLTYITNTTWTAPKPATTTGSILATILRVVSTTAAATTLSTTTSTSTTTTSTSTTTTSTTTTSKPETRKAPSMPKLVTEIFEKAPVPETLATIQIPSITESFTIAPTFPPPTPQLVAETPHEIVISEEVTEEASFITLPSMSRTKIITPNFVTKSSKMLKRQHDVLDPAELVEPVFNPEGQQLYGLREVPLYKNVESVPSVS